MCQNNKKNHTRQELRKYISSEPIYISFVSYNYKWTGAFNVAVSYLNATGSIVPWSSFHNAPEVRGTFDIIQGIRIKIEMTANKVSSLISYNGWVEYHVGLASFCMAFPLGMFVR